MFPRLKTSLHCCSRAAVLRWATVGLCVASLVANMALYLANQTIPATLLVLQLVATLGAVVQLGLSARSIHLRPAELAERMLKVQEDERQHLSRELHDDIGQLLTAAKLQLQWLQRRMPEDLQGHCEALRSTLDDTLGNVRDVSALLNPRQLASLGLEASLRAHLVRTLASSGVHWSLACNQRLGGIVPGLVLRRRGVVLHLGGDRRRLDDVVVDADHRISPAMGRAAPRRRTSW